jgi:hypothetical protein
MYAFSFKKLQEILKKSRYDFHSKPNKNFIRFLYYNAEGRPLNIETIWKAVKKYNEENSVKVFLKKTKFVKKSILNQKRNLVEMISRKHSPQFKITNPHGKGLSTKLRNRMSPLEKKFQVGFSPVKMLSNLPGGIAEIDGQLYKQDISTNELSLWRKVTPSKPQVSIASDLLSPEKEKSKENVLLYFSEANLPEHV